MKKYMIVYSFEDCQGASFAEDYTEARNKKMDVECGLGGYAEIYGREEHEDGGFSEYVLLEA
jgi:hypothetical protein